MKLIIFLVSQPLFVFCAWMGGSNFDHLNGDTISVFAVGVFVGIVTANAIV